MAKSIECNARIFITPTGKLRLGWVQFLGPRKKDSLGSYRSWKDAPVKLRREIGKSMNATLLPLKK